MVPLASGIDLRHDDGCVILPPHFGVRVLYSHWCWECGWKVMEDGSGNLGKVVGYILRPNDELDWPEGIVFLLRFAPLVPFGVIGKSTSP